MILRGEGGRATGLNLNMIQVLANKKSLPSQVIILLLDQAADHRNQVNILTLNKNKLANAHSNHQGRMLLQLQMPPPYERPTSLQLCA